MTRRIAFLIGLLFQALAVFAIFIPQVLLQANGTPITLKTVPVDPRSILRGDYVVLGYEAGTHGDQNEYGQVVYVVLEQKGDVYEFAGYTTDPAELSTGQVCLRGVNEYGRVRFPDIAQYFVEEGTGHELEQATRTHRLLVDVVVNDACRAAIKGVRLGPEVPPSELPTDSPFAPPRPVPTQATPVQ